VRIFFPWLEEVSRPLEIVDFPCDRGKHVNWSARGEKTGIGREGPMAGEAKSDDPFRGKSRKRVVSEKGRKITNKGGFLCKS